MDTRERTETVEDIIYLLSKLLIHFDGQESPEVRTARGKAHQAQLLLKEVKQLLSLDGERH